MRFNEETTKANLKHSHKNRINFVQWKQATQGYLSLLYFCTK